MNEAMSWGGIGTLLKAAGTITSGPYLVINALEDSEVTVVTNWTGADPTETLILDKGQSIYGVFTEITWVSGKIVAYESEL